MRNLWYILGVPAADCLDNGIQPDTLPSRKEEESSMIAGSAAVACVLLCVTLRVLQMFVTLGFFRTHLMVPSGCAVATPALNFFIKMDTSINQ